MKCFARVCCLVLALNAAVAIAKDEQAPLTDLPGRANVGEAVFHHREKGHCLLCHRFSASDAPFQGTIGPSLDGVGERLNEAQIRFRLVDQSRLNPDTIMPGYYRKNGLTQVAKPYRGKTVLTPQEIEDVVAYLVQAAVIDEGETASSSERKSSDEKVYGKIHD